MSPARVAIIGANGQLGMDLLSAFDGSFTVIGLTHDDIEVGDNRSVTNCLDSHDPDFVIDTAAIHDLEKCEDNPQQAFRVNGIGARNISRWCGKNGSVPVYISTDYVFGGTRNEPFTESDSPNPLNTYGVTKVTGEHYTAAEADGFLIVRTSGLFGVHPCRGKPSHNFVEMFIDLVEGEDQIEFGGEEVCSPTATHNLAAQIRGLLDSGQTGIFHAVSEGECSWFEFGQEIISQLDLDVSMEPREGEYEKTVRRPDYTALENCRLDEIKLNIMNHWKDNLAEYLERRR